MRRGQRGKFIGHENYDGCLDGGELFTVEEVGEYFEDSKTWIFYAILDTGDSEWLLSDQVEWLTEEDDLKTLSILMKKYPNEMKKLLHL